MKKQATRNGIYIYNMFSAEDSEQIRALGAALSSPIRLQLLHYLREGPKSLYCLQQLTGLSATSIAMHVKKLEAAKLARLEYSPSKKGFSQLVFLCLGKIEIFGDSTAPAPQKSLTVSMPVGLFTEAESYASYFRITTNNSDDLSYEQIPIFSPKRENAGMIYTDGGKVSYTFDKEIFKNKKISQIVLSLEICSECPYYSNTWKSDITFSINGKELCTYTCPGDFGDRPGKLSPSFWTSIVTTQYGQLVHLSVNETGTFFNQEPCAPINLQNFKIDGSENLVFSIETKKDAKFFGGFNIFGKNFGDYPQDIELTVFFEEIN